MLTAMKLSGNVDDITAYHSREENYYYSQGNEMQSLLDEADIKTQGTESLEYVQVHGKLCPDFNLDEGEAISESTFANLLQGNDPQGTKRVRAHKIHGIDLTFSAPKTVSIAGLVMDKSPAVIKAHDDAVLETMKEIEARHSIARPTSRTQWHTGNMLYVTVRDGFSREHDPHIHTHVIVLNVTRHEDALMGLWSREILNPDFNKTWGAVYRTRVAAKLKELGYAITYSKGGEWRLDKISHEAEKEFSTRRKQILQAEAEGKRDMDAWRKTRAKKIKKISKESIILNWRERIKKTNTKTEDYNRQQAELDRAQWAQQAVWSVEARQERDTKRAGASETDKWQLALRRATEKSATVSQPAIITEYLCECMREENWKDLTYATAARRLEAQVNLGHIIRNKDKRYTSLEMLKAEREYMRYAGKSVQGWPETTGTEVQSFLATEKEERSKAGQRVLSETQGIAVEKMITSNTRLTLVQGDAGSGKTTALKSAADFFIMQKMEVVGLSMQGITARNLEAETGIRSTTLSSFLSTETNNHRINENNKGRVIFFDEASMLDSRNAAELFKQVEKHNDRIILVGDVNQLESIAAGRVFQRLVNEAALSGDLINLNENFRQRDPELREAVDRARKGEMKESLQILEERGDVIEVQDRLDRRSTIAGLYDKETLIITNTLTARDEMNERIRARLNALGEINNTKSVTYTVARVDQHGTDHEREIRITKNDIVTFCKNEYKELDVRNGERGRVINTDERYIDIKLEDEREVRVDTEKYKHIDYGYALTTYKAQGQTYDKIIVESDTSIPSLNDMRNQYVNITRARDDIKIYTDDKDYLKELADIKTHARDTLDRSDITLDDIKRRIETLNHYHDRGNKPSLPPEIIRIKQRQIPNQEREHEI